MLEELFGKQKRSKSTHVIVTIIVDGVVTKIGLEYYTIYSSRFRKGGYVIVDKFPKMGNLCVKEESSFFHSLFKLRKKLEKENILMCVWGAKKSVWPSGMEADMGGGFSALDRDADGHVSKFILEEINSNEAISTSEQYEYIFKSEI